MKKSSVISCPDITPPNHPFVVWAACFLWFTSMFAISWSLILFFCVGDMLLLTGTDLINAVVLLSGIMMLPTNVYILCAVANGKRIDHRSRVVCCPLWLCILWIIAVNAVGIILCSHKISTCKRYVNSRINSTIKHYRSVPKYKHFIDDLQWSLRCCGLNSYKDWFNHEWHDKIRDYEWDPPPNNRHPRTNPETKPVADSVPLSCCKSGSCVSNYLIELGTGSINTRGCGELMFHIIIRSMIIHLILFISVIIVQLLILKFIMLKKDPPPPPPPKGCKKLKSHCSLTSPTKKYNVRHIMSVKDNFSASSASLQLNPDDSDEFERAERRPVTSRCIRQARAEKYRDFKKVDDEGPESPKEGDKWDED